MLFNSVTFALFFTVFYSLYLLLNPKGRNKILLAASYFFYAAWDWRFLFLLLFSTVLDFVLAQKIERASGRGKKMLLTLSVTASLSILGFFKYFNFFAENLHALFAVFGLKADFFTLQIILPVGVSFYTFQTIGYVTDVYRGKTPAVKNFLDFAVFVSFFPQLVAGPIERAGHMIPQIQTPRKITREGINEGLALFCWGLFKKTVIADNSAIFVERVFASSADLPGFLILAGVYAFAFQIYGDFSGYTDMARGLARLMGFELAVNFNRPYLAKNPPDFWRRWHISLSAWLRDYLYIPLGGNRGGNLLTCRNLMLTMLLGGLWHGAAWTFIAWGAYHGLLLIFHKLLPEPKNSGTFLTGLLKTIGMFHLTCFGWIFFRAGSLHEAFTMIERIFLHFQAGEFFSVLTSISPAGFAVLLAAAAILLFRFKHSEDLKPAWSLSEGFLFKKILSYSSLFFLILLLGAKHAQQFIYFQF